MCTPNFSFRYYLPLLAATIFVSSCNNFTTQGSQVKGESVDDSIAMLHRMPQQGAGTESAMPDTAAIPVEKLPLDTIDTLHKAKATAQTLSPKQERQRIKDSIRLVLDTKPKHIYLTFDDGPLKGSAAISAIASAKQVKINAFLVGRHAYMSKSLMKDLQKYKDNAYVECYNHSFTHGLNKFTQFYGNVESSFADFERNEKDLDLQHKIVRLPGRNIWIYDQVRRIDLNSGAATADKLFENGYKIFGWDVEWKINGPTGKPTQSVNEIYTRLRNYMNNKSSMEPNNVVLLMHDDMFQTAQGQLLLSGLIDSIQKNTNYSFEFMRDYPFKYN